MTISQLEVLEPANLALRRTGPSRRASQSATEVTLDEVMPEDFLWVSPRPGPLRNSAGFVRFNVVSRDWEIQNLLPRLCQSVPHIGMSSCCQAEACVM